MADNPTFIANLDGRQCVAVAHVKLSLADFVGRNNVVDMQVPDGAEVIAGDIVVTDAYDTTGTDTLSIGTPDNPTRYLGATNLKAAARTAVVPTGYQHTTAANIVRLTRAAADTAATKGTVYVTVQYVVEGKAEWTEG